MKIGNQGRDIIYQTDGRDDIILVLQTNISLTSSTTTTMYYCYDSPQRLDNTIFHSYSMITTASLIIQETFVL